jgi:hypothetical protein
MTSRNIQRDDAKEKSGTLCYMAEDGGSSRRKTLGKLKLQPQEHNESDAFPEARQVGGPLIGACKNPGRSLRRGIAALVNHCVTGRNIVGRKREKTRTKEHSRNISLCRRLLLFLHSAKEGIIIFVNTPMAARVCVAEVIVIRKTLFVHFDVFALVMVAIAASTYARLLRGHIGGAR